MPKHLTAVLLSAFFAIVHPHRELAAQLETSSLRRLTVVSVSVVVVSDISAPVDSSIVRTAVELRLRRMGIDVVPARSDVPVVALSITVAGTRDNVATAISLALIVVQEAALSRMPGVRGRYMTWASDRLQIVAGSGANEATMRRLTAVLDEFENAWRAMNPRP